MNAALGLQQILSANRLVGRGSGGVRSLVGGGDKPSGVCTQPEWQTNTEQQSVAVEEAATMEMDVKAVIERMETGDQDAALTALQSFNKEVT